MEPRIVEYAALTPGSCLLCGASEGPFLEHQTPEFMVATADGPQLIVGTIYLCIGTAQNPGCVPQAVEMIGGAGPWQLEAFADAARSRVAQLEDELAAALEERDVAVMTQTPVVRVDELLAEFTLSPRVPADPFVAPPQQTAPSGPPAPPHPDSIRARNASGQPGFGPGTEDYDVKAFTRIQIA